MKNSGRQACVLICALALGQLLISCKSIVAHEMAVPSEVQVPSHFVGCFREGSRLTVFGDARLLDERCSPCSTFKIVSTLMGLDGGVLKGLDTRLGYDGSQYEFDFWEGDLTLLEAFRVSCVPYYAKLMSRMRKVRVMRQLQALDYGNCDLSVWNERGHHVFWIGSSLEISPREQVEVLRRIMEGGSQFSEQHVRMLKTCLAAGEAGAWRLHGKTGAGRSKITGCLEGWYVGFAEKEPGRRIYFALHGSDASRDVTGVEMRKTARTLLRRQGG